MLDDPGGIDTHMIGHHVTGKPDPEPPRLVAQPHVRIVAAQIAGNLVVIERISRCHSILFAAEVLDRTRSAAALPQADEPERVHAAAGQGPELFVWYLIEPRNR